MEGSGRHSASGWRPEATCSTPARVAHHLAPAPLSAADICKPDRCHADTCLHTCGHTCGPRQLSKRMSRHLYIDTKTCKHISARMSMRVFAARYKHVCPYIYIHACTHGCTHVHMHAHTHVHTHVRPYACPYVCLYTCLHTCC